MKRFRKFDKPNLKRMVDRHRAKNWGEGDNRPRSRKQSELKILRGCRAYDNRIFAYDPPDIHINSNVDKLPDWWPVDDFVMPAPEPLEVPKRERTPREVIEAKRRVDALLDGLEKLDDSDFDCHTVEQTSSRAPFSWGADVDSEDDEMPWDDANWEEWEDRGKERSGYNAALEALVDSVTHHRDVLDTQERKQLEEIEKRELPHESPNFDRDGNPIGPYPAGWWGA